MASVSASHLIIFIASVLVAASVAGTITNTVGELSRALDTQGLDISQDVRSDVEIISDSGAAVYDVDGNGNVTLYVKNTGSQQLGAQPRLVDVFLDGQFRTAVSITVVDGETWDPGNVARIEISAPGLQSGDHRVKLVVNSDEEVFRFKT